jgi:hypothetical protein
MHPYPELEPTLVDGLTNQESRPGTTMPLRGGPLSGLWRWVKSELVGEVPQGDALCAFDCPRNQCHRSEWAACTRRLAQAEGELWPKGDDAKTRNSRLE